MPILHTPPKWPAILAEMLRTDLAGRREIVAKMTEDQREAMRYLYTNEVERRKAAYSKEGRERYEYG